MILQKCQIHSEEEYKFICLYPHECEKKLCRLCLDCHNNEISEMQFIQVDNFFVKMNEMFNSFHFNSEIDLNQIIIGKSINEIQQLYERLFQTIKYSLLILFSGLKQYNEKYENLIQILREQNFEKLTIEDLQILTSPQMLNKIIQQNKLKTDLANELIIRVNSLEKELKYFSCNIMGKVNRNNVSQEKQSIKKEKKKKILNQLEDDEYQLDVEEHQLEGEEYQLEGVEYFGFKHGEYKFKNRFGQLEKAGYYFFDKKDGLWVEDNYQIQSKGEYKKGLKVKKWEYFCNGKLIAQQKYDKQGQKQEGWNYVVTDEAFYSYSYQREVKEVINRIGGGFYDEQGRKNGFWKDVSENLLMENHQIIWEGLYESGVRIGEWKIFCNFGQSELTFDKMIYIGGGNYTNQGLKFGKWREIYGEEDFQNLENLNILFNKDVAYSQIIWKGKYEYGLKVGEWKIQKGAYYGSFRLKQMEFEDIGGGNYDKGELKIGKWQEVEEKFIKLQEVKQVGDSPGVLCQRICQVGHYIANRKVGQWKTIIYWEFDRIIQIGGGLYDETGLKKGWWIDIVENQYNQRREFWEGNYIAGVRVGKWKLFEIKSDQDKPKLDQIIQLREGDFNTQGQKVGFWKDIVSKKKAHFIWEGQYKEGIRVGVWKIFYNQKESSNYLLIGGGEFNDNGEKIGSWEEINENYYDQDFQVAQKGYYKLGRRIGYWKLVYQQNQVTREYHLGNYDEKGEKISLWYDVDENYFQKKKQIINVGYYSHNIKYGKWDIMYNDQNDPNFEIVGGGLYNRLGQKIGFWREIDANAFSKKIKIFQEGKYLDDIRIGKWKIFCKEWFTQEFEQIGGGEYNDQGVKIGQWKEIKENCYNSKIKIIWEGEYQAGVKVGNWNIYYKKFFDYFDRIMAKKPQEKREILQQDS